MSIEISRVRVSFVWMAPGEHLLAEPPPAEPFAFLGREGSYVDRFRRVQRYDGDPDGLTPPWPKHREPNYWSLFLRNDPHDVDANTAWRHFVPLRWQLPADVQTPGLNARIKVEAFFYPHGHALVFTADLRPPAGTSWDPEQATDVAHRLRFRNELAVGMRDGETRQLKLDTFAADALSRVRGKARGAAGPAARPVPYSVTTFMRLEGVAPGRPLAEKGEVHRMLEAVARWPKSWRTARLPSLARASVGDDGLPVGDVLYRGSRGRAVWFPSLLRVDPSGRSIGCYHRNQTLAALQVESAGALVRRTADPLRRGAAIPFAQGQLARIAAGLLGRVYGGTDDTYRSLACQRHLHDRGIVEDLGFLRDRFGMSPLHVAGSGVARPPRVASAGG